MPRTRTLRGQRLQLLLVDIEVGVDALHVVVLFQRVLQAQHAGGVFALQFDQVLGDPGDGGILVGNVVGVQYFEDALVAHRIGENLPLVAQVAQVVGSGIQIGRAHV